MADPVIHPLGLGVLRAYLLDQPAVTAFVGSRVSVSLEAGPTFPALRLTELTSNEVTARRWMRMLVQIDAWATRQTEADRLARAVLGVLRESANYQTADAVLGESTDLSARSQPDTTIEPSQPRAIVTAHIWIRPNP